MPTNPKPRNTAWIKALSIIFDADTEMIRLLAHYDPYVLRICVLRAIIQSFLNDSVYARLMLFRQIVRNILFHRIDEAYPCVSKLRAPAIQSAGTRPRSSNIEGRSSSAILRTSLTQFSASVLIF